MLRILKSRARKFLLFAFDVVNFYMVAVFVLLLTRATASPVFGYGLVPYFLNATLLAVLTMGCRALFGVYRNVWRYTDTKSYFKLILADAAAGFVSYLAAFGYIKLQDDRYYLGFWFFVILIMWETLATLISRYVYRLLYKYFNSAEAGESHRVRVAIVGAGEHGATLAHELAGENSGYRPVFFIDRDEAKIGSRVAGLPVYREELSVFERLAEAGVEELFFAMANLSREDSERLYHFYSTSHCKLKVFDMSIYSSDRQKARVIREFSIEDLLFRDPLSPGDDKTRRAFSGKTILITGGGGSIGSELCRGLAACAPKRLVILDIHENGAYELEQELKRKYENLDVCVEIASVRDRERIEELFSIYRPEAVFHAAAHKHVPLMERDPREAVKNNIFGTKNVMDMSEAYGAETFVLISTDKAVNPTGVMGATKRFCEMLVQARGDSKTNFVAVRFGNVLGSNGSVIPLFKRQIAEGGPVTITDRRMTRYFMTIPEAVGLVIQAGAMAKKGELFVLDMGKPIRIYDLAVNLIRLSGLEPEKDIEIREVGLRPGEKLEEELLMKSDRLSKTENEMIFIEKEAPRSRAEMDAKLAVLQEALLKDDASAREALKQTVETYI